MCLINCIESMKYMRTMINPKTRKKEFHCSKTLSCVAVRNEMRHIETLTRFFVLECLFPIAVLRVVF